MWLGDKEQIVPVGATAMWQWNAVREELWRRRTACLHHQDPVNEDWLVFIRG